MALTNKAVFELDEKDRRFLRERAKETRGLNHERILEQSKVRLMQMERSLRGAQFIPSFVSRLIEDLHTLHDMVKDATYPLNLQAKDFILFGLNYLIDDSDAIPDTIPVVGYMDDVVVLGWVCCSLEHELKRYRIAKNLNTGAPR